MKDQTIIVLCGILCLSALESIALVYGYNGTLFTIVVASITGAIGVMVPLESIKKILKGGK